MIDKMQLLKELPFWNDLSEKEQESTAGYAQIRSYKTGNIIHSADHECLGMIRIISGSIRTFVVSEEGREITLYNLKSGDTDVLSASCVVNQITFEAQLVAERDCELMVIPALWLSELKEKNLAVRCVIFEKLTERFSDVMQVIQKILFMRIDQRVAGYLVSATAPAAGNAGKSCRKEDPPVIMATHEQIAGEINSSREVVSRMLKQFEKEGLICLGRGQIRILDRAALEDICI